MGLIEKYNKILAKYFIIFDYETITAKKTNNRLGYSKKISRMFALIEELEVIRIKVRT